MAKLEPKLFFCNTKCFSINIDILNRLPIERCSRIKHAINPEKALQLYVSFLLLRYILELYGESLDNIQVTELGKPYLDSDLHFNISHSGHYVVMAVGPHDIGVDIQEKIHISDIAAQMFFDNDDFNDVFRSKSNYSHLWCRKEAFLKCIGVGWNGKKESILSVMKSEFKYEECDFFLTDYLIFKNYYIALCEKNSHQIFTIEEVQKYELELFYNSN